ncbi:MAG: hypothetical protein FWD66_10550 [Paludibacter sp.]|nr:hypothetical protein [Paludibacter sp.]
MKKILLAFLLFFCLSSNGQDTVAYRFIDENILNYKNIKDVDEDIFAKSFTYQRIYDKDSVFKEIPGLLYDGKPYKFKILGDNWFIKKAGKWQLFYLPYAPITPKIKIYFPDRDSWYFNFKAVRTDTLFGHRCIIYEIEPIPKIRTIGKIQTITTTELGDSPRYWFSPKFGIIKIETGGARNYIREDIIPVSQDL